MGLAWWLLLFKVLFYLTSREVCYKPFRVGHLIEAQGIIATVDEIQIFVTKLTTANNQTVLCQMVFIQTDYNYSMEKFRRAFGILHLL
jgi:hypothetical protein